MAGKTLVTNGKVLLNNEFVQLDIVIRNRKIECIEGLTDQSSYEKVIDANYVPIYTIIGGEIAYKKG